MQRCSYNSETLLPLFLGPQGKGGRGRDDTPQVEKWIGQTEPHPDSERMDKKKIFIFATISRL